MTLTFDLLPGDLENLSVNAHSHHMLNIQATFHCKHKYGDINARHAK